MSAYLEQMLPDATVIIHQLQDEMNKMERELDRNRAEIDRLKEDLANAKDELKHRRDAKLKPKTVYTVTMYRYGNREWHSYVLGAFSSNDIAREWAVKEEEYRDGKYKAEIIRCEIDSPTDFLKDEL